jgi:hypothetical protein
MSNNDDQYEEVDISESTSLNQTLLNLGLKGCFEVNKQYTTFDGSPRTVLNMSPNYKLFDRSLKVHLIDVPGTVVEDKDTGSIHLNWCVPKYYNNRVQDYTCLYVVNSSIPNTLVPNFINEHNYTMLKLYKLKPKISEPEVMNLSNEINQLKIEVARLKNLLANVEIVPEPAPAPKQFTFPSTVSDYYKPSMQQEIIRAHPSDLKFIHMQSDDIVAYATMLSPRTLQYVHKQTDDLCASVVAASPRALKWVEHQTVDICKLAILGDASTIGLVRTPTVELIDFALQQEDPNSANAIASAILALSAQVDTQQYSVFKSIVFKTPSFLAYVPEKFRTLELVKTAIDIDVSVLAFLADQTPYTEYAIDRTWEALAYIRHVTPELYNYTLDLYGHSMSNANPSGYSHLPIDFIKYINMLDMDSKYDENISVFEQSFKTK